MTAGVQPAAEKPKPVARRRGRPKGSGSRNRVVGRAAGGELVIESPPVSAQANLEAEAAADAEG